MTKRLTDKQKSDRAYIRQFRKADPQGLGPYNIIWGSKDPRGTAHVRLDPKVREIRIPEKHTKDQPATEEYEEQLAAPILGHEIAHTRLLRSFPQDEWPEGTTDEDIDAGYHGSKMYVWRELAAVLYQLAKGWDLERWFLIGELHDASTQFGDGTLNDGKMVAKKVLERQVKRGHITKEQSRKAIGELDAVTSDEWKQYEGTYQYTPDYKEE